jgi:hypothetical protein
MLVAMEVAFRLAGVQVADEQGIQNVLERVQVEPVSHVWK